MSLRWRIAVGLAVIAALVCAFGATGAYLDDRSDQLQNSVDESLARRGHPRRRQRRTAVPGRRTTAAAATGPASATQGCPPPGELQPAVGRAASSPTDGTACIEAVAIPSTAPTAAR